MWRQFQPDVVRQELRVLAEHGLNVTRSFFFLPHFMPAPNTLDEDCVARYAEFLDLSQEEGIPTIPTFIVGHMSGENWDVPWRGDRDIYADGWMLAQQAWFIRNLAGRFKDHPAVAAWLISNEITLYGGNPRPEYGRSWAELMVQAVRAAGATQPVSLGDGAWGIEVTGADNGFRLRDLADTVDFFGPHVYPMSDDPVRQHLTAAFNCELSHFGKPVILEEFGVTTDFASGEHAADYYRQVLHTTLLAGAVGWIAWNNTDFDLVAQDPYRHHPFELHFGITRVDGSPKPALLELARFRRLLDQLDITNCRRAPTSVYIVSPSYLDTAYPFTRPEERRTLRDILLQSYVVAREADLSPGLVRELDGIPDARLLLLPSLKWLTGPTWERLEECARKGSTVYVSYFAGSTPAQRGPWYPSLNRFFGVEHQLRYGLLDTADPDTVAWTFLEDFGNLRAGDHLTFRVGGNEHGRAFLPVVPREARIKAVDQHERPALVERAVGKGCIVLSTYPVEYFAANRAGANPEATYQLYQSLAARARVERHCTVDRPDILVDTVLHADGTEFVWLVSENQEATSVSPNFPEACVLVDLESGQQLEDPAELPAYGVRVFRLGGVQGRIDNRAIATPPYA
jgi:endo-1,4-beta-mannosidase